MAIKIILTDLGNVVLYFNFGLLIQRLSERSGLLDVEIRNKLTAPDSLFTKFAEGKINGLAFHREICRELGMQVGLEEFQEIWCNIFSPNARVIELWKSLKNRGYKIVLLSNLDVWHHRWVNNYFKLDFLDEELYSFELSCVKPDEKIYDIALRWCACEKNEIVFIDDLEHNIIAAQKFGFHTIHYTGDFQKLCDELRKLGVRV